MTGRRILNGTLIASLTLQACAGPAHASDEPLDAAFSNFKTFARQAEEPAALPAPSIIEPAINEHPDWAYDHLYLTPGVYVIEDYQNPTRAILAEGEREFAARIAELLAALGGPPRATSLTITKSPLHDVTLTIPGAEDPQRHYDRLHQHLTISVGTLALAENWDELAGVIAQAVARTDPRVYGHRDDPRVTRRLEEQAGFDRLRPRDQRRVLADLSAIERLRACELRPWGLTDFELRVFTYFRDQWSRWPLYYFSRRKVLKKNEEPFYQDSLFEARVLAQKVAIAYLQERENVRDLVKTPHPFDPAMAAIHRRAQERAARGLSFFKPILTAGSFAALPAVPFVFGTNFFTERIDAFGARVDRALRPLLDGAVYRGARELVEAAVHLARRTFGALVDGGAVVLSKFIDLCAILVDGFVWFAHALGPWLALVFGPIFAAIAAVCMGFDAALVWLFDHVVPALTGYRWAIVGGLVLAFIFSNYLVPAFRAIVVSIGELFLVSYYTIVSMARALVHGGYIESLVARTPVAQRGELFRALGEDLRLLYTEAVRTPDYGLRFRYAQLGPLQPNYTVSTEYWRYLRHTLDALTREVAHGRVSAEDAASVLEAWSPDLPPLLTENRHGQDRREVQPLLEALHHRRYRRRLTALYRAIRGAAPGDALPLTKLETRVTWADLSEARTSPSVALGMLRVVAEAEDLLRDHDLARLPRLHDLLFDHLRLYEVINPVHRAHLPTLLSQVFAGDFDLDLAERLRAQFDEARTYGKLADNPALRGSGWVTMARAFARARSLALVRGDLGVAVALSTWVSKFEIQAFFLRDLWAMLPLIDSWFTQRPLKQATDQWLRHELGRRRTVRELADFTRREIIDRGAVREVITPIIYQWVLTHPELIAEEADVDALLGESIFWPTAPIQNHTIVDGILMAFFRYGPIDKPLGEALRAKRAEYPRVWTYQSNLAEELHLLIKKRLRELGRWPEDYEGLKATWRRLSERGVTAETDRILQRLIEIAPDGDLPELVALVIEEGRVWETALHSRLSIAQLRAGDAHKRLLAAAIDDPGRPKLVEEVVSELQSSIPERGLAYAHFLEDLSVRLKSTYVEARHISRAKADVVSTGGRDSNVAAMEGVFRAIQSWPRPQQLRFIRFLRGDRPANRRIRMAFPLVGLERIRRMYEVLPTAARVGVLDTFLTHALIGQDRFATYWTRKLATEIVGRTDTEAQRVTLEVLTAFLFAVGQVGNQQMVTTILSYLYALPSTSTAKPVEVLKLVLEIFGATGIKVGQFIYASQILGEAGDALRSLQSQARVPDRIEMYEDVYDLLGVPVGDPLPFAVLDLLGAASMKYAFMAEDRRNLAKIVVKVFRLDAMNNVDLQFDVLEHMGDDLIRRFGPKYGPFKVIIKTARRAVKREGSMPNEIRRSRIAREHVYRDRSTSAIHVEVPKEDLVNARMVISQFAEGVPFDELPEVAKPLFARLLLEMENDIIFADADVIRFDPDRHAGNSQLLFRLDDHDEVVLDRRHRLQPIDFGQLLRLTRAQRTRIIDLFALAQIAVEARGNAWCLREIAKLLDMNEEQRRRLGLHLGRFARKAQKRPVSRYMSVLAALEASGYAIRDSIYVDFVRGIIQLTPFERFAPDAAAPSRSFERAVAASLKTYAADFQFDDGQLRLIGLHNGWQRARGWFTGRTYRLLPTDLTTINFDEFIHRESDADCERALAIAD